MNFYCLSESPTKTVCGVENSVAVEKGAPGQEVVLGLRQTLNEILFKSGDVYAWLRNDPTLNAYKVDALHDAQTTVVGNTLVFTHVFQVHHPAMERQQFKTLISPLLRKLKIKLMK